MNKATNETYPIIDRGSLASELRKAIEAKHGGSINRAAAALSSSPGISISQPTLSRLLNCQTGRVDKGTLLALEKLVAKSSIAARAFYPPAAELRLKQHERAIVKRCAQYVPDPDGEARVKRLLRRMARIVALRPVAAEMIRGLHITPTHPIFESMIEALGGTSNPRADITFNGIAGPRYRLAILRTLSPLLDENHELERLPTELSDAEFTAFIAAGWKRESILLRREGDFLRAQDADKKHLRSRIKDLLASRE